jgi:hypothetical protein
MIPTIEITDIGLVAPTREAITVGLWEIMRGAFGEDLNEDARTPQGQLVTSLTAAIDNQNSAMIALGNNFDPRYAIGQFQEALGAVYFLTRKLATRSIAMLDFIGIGGTVIPQGYIIVDEAGFEWEVAAASVVGAGLVAALCTTTGPIQAAPLTITTFKETIDGLDRVENPAAAAVGSNQESRSNFETRRYESVAANSKNMNASVRGAVGNLAGVIDVFVADNPTDASIVIGETDYPMIRNSLLVSVVGGDDQQLAEMILIKGGTGCAFVGNTSILWKDEASGGALPPEYIVKLERPAHVTVSLRLTVVDPSAISYANSQAAKAQIVSDFQSGEYRARIGGLVVGANYLLNLDSALLRPVKLELSTDGVVWDEFMRFGVDQYPVTSTANVTLVGI